MLSDLVCPLGTPNVRSVFRKSDVCKFLLTNTPFNLINVSSLVYTHIASNNNLYNQNILVLVHSVQYIRRSKISLTYSSSLYYRIHQPVGGHVKMTFSITNQTSTYKIQKVESSFQFVSTFS